MSPAQLTPYESQRWEQPEAVWPDGGMHLVLAQLWLLYCGSCECGSGSRLSWSVAHDDNWEKRKSQRGYRCMSLGTATWRTPVDVWGWVVAWSSEFQETTLWGRSSESEQGMWVSQEVHVLRLHQQQVLHMPAPSRRGWGTRRLVYWAVCCPLEWIFTELG